MIPRNILFLFIFFASISTTTNAQAVISGQYSSDVLNDAWKYYTFRQPSSPTTHALARKRQLRIEVSPQFRLTSKFKPVFNFVRGDDRDGFYSSMSALNGKDLFSSIGIRANLSYTLCDNITIGAAFLFDFESIGVGHVISSASPQIISLNNISRHQIYYHNYKSVELSSTYHSIITNFLAYEARTSISFGNARQEYEQSYAFNQGKQRNSIGYVFYDDRMHYNFFNHSFVGGLSFFTPRRTLQATLLLDVGYTTYFNKQLERPFYSRQLYDQVIDPFNRNPWDLYCAPWFMLSINTPAVFSIRFHYGFEVSKQHRRYSSAPLRSTAGVTLSWRLTNARMVPKE